MHTRLYDVLEVAIVVAGMTAALWITASRFDSTEVKSLMILFALLAGSKGAASLWHRSSSTAS